MQTIDKPWLLNKLVAGFRRLPLGRRTCFNMATKVLAQPEQFLGTLDGQWFCVDSLDEDISLRTYILGEWELPVSSLWVHLLKPGMNVLDIGANKGYFSLLAAKRITATGSVISYEPHPRNVGDVEATIEANNYTHWQARSVAISDEIGTAEFYTPGWDEGVSGWGSFERKEGESTIEVKKTTLDAEFQSLDLKRIDLLKMDIEGHEYEAFLGAKKCIQNGLIDRALVELHVELLGPERLANLVKIFSNAGYKSFLLKEDAVSNKQWQQIFHGEGIFPTSEALVSISDDEIIALDPNDRPPHILWEK